MGKVDIIGGKGDGMRTMGKRGAGVLIGVWLAVACGHNACLGGVASPRQCVGAERLV